MTASAQEVLVQPTRNAGESTPEWRTRYTSAYDALLAQLMALPAVTDPDSQDWAAETERHRHPDARRELRAAIPVRRQWRPDRAGPDSELSSGPSIPRWPCPLGPPENCQTRVVASNPSRAQRGADRPSRHRPGVRAGRAGHRPGRSGLTNNNPHRMRIALGSSPSFGRAWWPGVTTRALKLQT